MGLGPDTKKELTVKERLFPAHGTLAQLWKLQEEQKKLKEEEKKKTATTADGGATNKNDDAEGMLLSLPRGRYPDLDKFEDILEAGSRVATRSQRLLIALPLVLLELNLAVWIYVTYQIKAYTSGENGMTSFELIDQKSYIFQFSLVIFSFIAVSMLMALQPTFVRGIAVRTSCLGPVSIHPALFLLATDATLPH